MHCVSPAAILVHWTQDRNQTLHKQGVRRMYPIQQEGLRAVKNSACGAFRQIGRRFRGTIHGAKTARNSGISSKGGILDAHHCHHYESMGGYFCLPRLARRAFGCSQGPSRGGFFRRVCQVRCQTGPLP